MSPLDPSPREIALTRILQATLAARYYRDFVRQLTLSGDEWILDVGSGAGAVAHCLVDRLPRGCVTCLDVSPVWLAVARRALAPHRNVTYREADIANAPLPSAAYHAATLHFVLHELPAAARLAALTNLARALRPGGLLYLREPVAHGLAPAEIAGLVLAAGFTPLRTSLQTMPLFGSVFTGVFTVPGSMDPSRGTSPAEPQVRKERRT